MTKPTARINNATEASFSYDDLDHPFAEGSFRWVAKGQYTEGQRKGEACVTKWFKSGFTFEEEFYAKDIKAVDKALEILEKWNSKGFIDKHIHLNKPEVWTFKQDARKKWAGSKTLIEPFIENYQKWNSNSGWNDSSLPWPKVMQAVSHFSYQASFGQLVLCDLQGGQYSDGIVLTDPVILSRCKVFGPTDLGAPGISTFFCRHVCNEFCRSSWLKPIDRNAYFEENQGTSMISSVEHLTMVPGKPLMTRINE